MNFKAKAIILASAVSISAFAYAQSGVQTKPLASNAGSTSSNSAATAEKSAPKAGAKKKPLGFTWGWDVRLRSDAQNNSSDFTDDANDEDILFRITPHIMASADLGKGVHFNFKEGADFYKKVNKVCNNASTLCGSKAGTDQRLAFAAQDIWVDAANFKFDQLPWLPHTSLQIGRFDLRKGDGFLLWSGVPGAGPKASFYDGILITHKMGKNTFDLFATKNDSTNDFFPTIHKYYNAMPSLSATKAPTLYNDMGDLGAIIGYYTNRQFKNTDIDAYYGFYKQDYMLPVGYYLGMTTADQVKGYANIQYQPDRHWNAIGGRLVQRFPGHTIVHANFTGEIGSQDAMTQKNNPNMPAAGYPHVAIHAYAWNASVNKYAKIKFRPFAGFAYSYYSGSDPKNPKVDGNYYPAFGEFATTQHPGPFMEEGYPVQGLVADSDGTSSQKEIGLSPWYMSNYISYRFRAGFTPWEHKEQRIFFIGDFHYIGAPHPFMANSAHYNQNPAADASATTLLTPVIGSLQPFFDVSSLGRKHRENQVGAEVDYIASESFSFFCYWSRALYGDSNFYKSSWTQDTYSNGVKTTGATVNRASYSDFVRMNVSYRFKSFVPYKKK